jgi:hypothetical protein
MAEMFAPPGLALNPGSQSQGDLTVVEFDPLKSDLEFASQPIQNLVQLSGTTLPGIDVSIQPSPTASKLCANTSYICVALETEVHIYSRHEGLHLSAIPLEGQV